MKELKIFQDEESFVIERTNEFGHATKRFFKTKESLLEGLKDYGETGEIKKGYRIQVTDKELMADIAQFLLNYTDRDLRGGKREGAGRTPIGTTKKVSLTLPDEIWEQIEEEKRKNAANQSETLRSIIESHFAARNC